MSESKLTDEAKSAIRSYMVKIAVPSGAILGIIASIVVYLIQDVAISKTTIEVYDKANAQIHELLIKASDANAKADTARQKIKDTENEVVGLRNKLLSAHSDIDSLVQRTKDSASLVTSDRNLEKIANNLSKSPDFLNRALSSSEMPVGAVVSSLLPPHKFLSEINKGKWIAADGQEIPRHSSYFKMSGRQRSPDLRGMFLRGLNTFESGQPPRQDGLEDPDGGIRTAGDFQIDEIKAHKHTIGINGTDTTTMVPGTQRLAHFRNDAYGAGESKQTNLYGAKETRPKNIAVYFYLKIN
jgi:hypothetical protein